MRKTIIMTLIMLVVTAGTVAAGNTIRITSVPWPPYYGQFLDNYGIGPHVIKAVYEKIGRTPQFNFQAWATALKDGQEGKHDAVCNAYFSEERTKIFFMSDPYLESEIVFFKRKGESITWSTLEDLKPYRIGVVRGYANSEEFDSADFLKKKEARSDLLNIKSLILKQTDLIVLDKLVAFQVNNTKLFGREKDAIEPLTPPLYVHKLHLLFSRANPESEKLVKEFNQGLQEIKQDGTYKKIMDSYGF